MPVWHQSNSDASAMKTDASFYFKKQQSINCIKVPNKLQKDQNIFKICKRCCENKMENSEKDTKKQT